MILGGEGFIYLESAVLYIFWSWTYPGFGPVQPSWKKKLCLGQCGCPALSFSAICYLFSCLWFHLTANTCFPVGSLPFLFSPPPLLSNGFSNPALKTKVLSVAQSFPKWCGPRSLGRLVGDDGEDGMRGRDTQQLARQGRKNCCEMENCSSSIRWFCSHLDQNSHLIL